MNTGTEDSKVKVLLVDDDLPMRKLIKQYLAEMGIQDVVDRSSLGGGLNGSSLEGIGLILCDWALPGMNGLEFFKNLQRNPKFKSIPFVMITSTREKSRLAEAIKEGVANFILKPFDNKVFEKKVREILKPPVKTVKSVFSPDPSSTVNVEGIVQVFEKAEERFGEKSYSLAQEEFQEVVKMTDEFIKFNNTDFVNTLKAIEKASKAWFYIGRIVELKQKLYESIDYYQKSLDALENDLAHIGLGRIYLRIGKYDTALEHFRNALTNNAENQDAIAGFFKTLEPQDLTPEKFAEVVESIPKLPLYLRHYFKAEFAFDKIRQNMAKFKDPENTQTTYPAFVQRLEKLRETEALFLQAFDQRPASVSKEMAAMLKERVESVRGAFKVFREFRKEKIRIYGAKLDLVRPETFENYFVWSETAPQDMTLNRFADMQALDKKNPLPLYYMGKVLSREILQTGDQKQDPSKTGELVQKAKKLFGKARDLEDPKGFLVPYIDKAMKELEPASSAA